MKLLVIGLIAGVFSALFGVGGGLVIVPLLLMWLKFPLRGATATSLGAVAITALAGVITYGLHGVVEPGKVAHWISPPRKGINNLATDFTYVRAPSGA